MVSEDDGDVNMYVLYDSSIFVLCYVHHSLLLANLHSLIIIHHINHTHTHTHHINHINRINRINHITHHSHHSHHSHYTHKNILHTNHLTIIFYTQQSQQSAYAIHLKMFMLAIQRALIPIGIISKRPFFIFTNIC